MTAQDGTQTDSPRTTRSRILFWSIVLALLLLTPSFWLLGADSSGTIQGRWMIDFKDDGSIHLTLQRRSDGHGNWNSSSGFALKDFQGLRRPSGQADAPVHFEMVRDAGTIVFDGQLDEGGGAGRFAFTASPEYVGALAKMGYGKPQADELFSLAVHDVSRAFIGDLEALGYKHVPLDDLLSLQIHRAGPEFIRELKSLGYDRLSTDDLVSMRIHGVTPEFIRQLKSLGYDRLSPDDLVSMRIHGVTSEFIRDLKSLGYESVPADELVSMRIHGVSIDYIKKTKERLKNVPIDELVEMRIHGKN